jgi:hypothetical protein
MGEGDFGINQSKTFECLTKSDRDLVDYQIMKFMPFLSIETQRKYYMLKLRHVIIEN